jgi:ABC-type amino acid transport substrate-binding protein
MGLAHEAWGVGVEGRRALNDSEASMHKLVNGLAIVFFLFCLPLQAAESLWQVKRGLPPQMSQAGDLSDILHRGYFRVAMIDDLPPFVQIPLHGQPHGLDVELVAQIAREMGVKAQIWVVSKPAELVQWVLQGRVDFAVSNISMTTQSTQHVNFAMPYLVANFAMLVNRYQAEQLGLDDQLGSYNKPACRLGYVVATSNVAKLKFPFGNATKHAFASYPLALQALKEAKIDALFADSVTLRHYYTADSDNAFDLQLVVLPGFYLFSGIAERFSSLMLNSRLRYFIQQQYANSHSILSQAVRDYQLNYLPGITNQVGRPYAS